ncbi:hypothetical protein LQ327_24240 [Actinomycetospora endophytica]|uniref:DUF308 domain-containing protein n=1 Tax=Actinomycetospora endophytica TaxID=2291215 RepID=A0ABS8PE09_9PSEU|nr:hypothetical protein [Actinomycetospora endophytica]MCD2196488.1 hypothetical protein [Actinomycetospora endophytica]
MSSPDPEETPRPETPRRSDDAGLSPGSNDARRFEMPEDVDAAFAAIVADWAGTDAPRWPQDPTEDGPSSGIGLATPPQGQPEAHPERRDDDLFTTGPMAPGPHSPGAPPTPPAGARPTGPAAQEPPPVRRDAADDHFVPPDPPPLPRIGMSSLLGLLLLVAGVVLLALPALVGGELAGLGIVPGLLAMAAGLGWLVVGMRRSSEDDHDAGPDEHGTV